jgi:hypothetical protein
LAILVFKVVPGEISWRLDQKGKFLGLWKEVWTTLIQWHSFNNWSYYWTQTSQNLSMEYTYTQRLRLALSSGFTWEGNCAPCYNMMEADPVSKCRIWKTCTIPQMGNVQKIIMFMTTHHQKHYVHWYKLQIL